MQIALIGTGGIAQTHIRAWLTHQQPSTREAGPQGVRGWGADLTLLCDVRAQAAEETRSRHNIPDARIVTSFEDALASDVDAVDICTPSALHAEQVIAALQAGKHVLSEKPMADTVEEAEQIAAACRAHPNLVYLCEHRYLYDPLVIALRGALSEIGTPRWFRLRGAHANDLSPHIKAMGALLDMGYHQLYTALHFMGDATTAFALKQSLTRPDLADDTGVVVLEHPHGGSVVESSFAAIGPLGGTRPIELYGQHGTLIGNWLPKPHLTLYRGAQGEPPGPSEPVAIPSGSWINNVTRHFLDCIAGLATPLSGHQPALTTMRTYAAALRSSQSGRAEPVT
ncbi:MAG TPA: Gfo/Idh/MocA family oxidoreductase [Chloroflexota bacterium]|nr:Gfo/Idh/MocA family oxidoreductase [Chloroflexota bacterium]